MSSQTHAKGTAFRPLEYEALNFDKGEIRLATVLPAAFNDPIKITFRHVYLPVPDRELASPGPDPARLRPLRASLPAGWRAEYTLEGRLLFWAADGSQSSWTHPDLSCSLDVGDFVDPVDPADAEVPDFEALSYCWGAPEPEETIFIEADEPPFTMDVQPNLAQALRHLRRTDAPRTLWIDAICINQGDMSERGRHVTRMGSIYALAPRVVAWLGPATATSDAALTTLATLGRQIEITASGGYRAPDADHPEWYARYPCAPATWAALQRLFWDHAWWQRLWIWQEILLARCSAAGGAVLQCGRCVVPWYLVRRGLRLLRETVLPDAAMRTGLCPLPVWWLPHAVAATSIHDWDSLAYLLRSTSQSGCADPRDRIYALLGLVPRRLADAIVPNYAVAPAQVFRDAFLAFLQVHHNLILLKFCDATARSPGWDGPSWVPDWQVGVTVTPQQARAAGSTTAHAVLVAPDRLTVRGVAAARVAAISTAHWRPGDTQAAPAAVFSKITASHSLWMTHHAPTASPIDFFTTIRYGWVGERRNIGVTAQEYADEFEKLVQRGTAATNDDHAHSHLVQDMLRDDKNCTFFCTADGLPGMGPISMASGDIVAVLLGCPHPIILRELGSSDDGTDSTYSVIGPAYVNGLMESQALLGPLPAPWRIRVDWSTGKERWLSFNAETKELVSDVRLGDLPAGWTQSEDGTLRDEHGNVKTEDPRESLEALTARGVSMQTFCLC